VYVPLVVPYSKYICPAVIPIQTVAFRAAEFDVTSVASSVLISPQGVTVGVGVTGGVAANVVNDFSLPYAVSVVYPG